MQIIIVIKTIIKIIIWQVLFHFILIRAKKEMILSAILNLPVSLAHLANRAST